MTSIKSLPKSPFKFIIEPVGGQYNNTAEVGGKTLIINSSIEEAADVNRYGKILALPLIYSGNAQVGDVCVVQHNVFRITYNDKGVTVQSNHYLKDGIFHVDSELIYLLIRDGKKIGFEDNVFVEPVFAETEYEGKIESPHIGIVRITNPKLEKIGITEGTKIAFYQGCEYPFEIDGQRLYKMSNKRIMATLN